MCYWKDKIIKSEIKAKVKHIIQKLHLNKRIKTGENYGETIIAMSENVSTSSAAKLPNCQYNKAALKLEGSVTNAATYYFTSINGNK